MYPPSSDDIVLLGRDVGAERVEVRHVHHVDARGRDELNLPPGARVDFDDLVLADNEIRYHWTLTGASTGPDGAGRQVRISGYEVWTIGTNGLIATSRGHFDSEDYRRQMGE